MKKIILIILICAVMILGITVYVINKNKFDIGNKSDIEIVEKEVTLSIKENTLTKTGATLILKNNSDVDIIYDNPYEIEIKKHKNWYKIQAMLNFTLPIFHLKSKEEKEIELNWKNGYGKLSKGNYRIIKNIGKKNENGDFEKFYVSAEFTIE